MIFLAFLWFTLVLLIAAYINIVAATFKAVPAAATSAMLFIPLAILFGIALYRLRLPLSQAAILGVILLAGCIVSGSVWPVTLSFNTWLTILIIYIFAASVAPVWILLQPRDFLNSFLLYALIFVAIIGIFASRPEVQIPAFVSFYDKDLGPLFPILFVTVACGAISGYHSVVASGTTAKQLNRELDARPIGYGAMLVESLVSVIALIVVIRLALPDYVSELGREGPVALFSRGIGSLLTRLDVPPKYGTDFAALAVSAFVLTTLDTATRLARFAFQEFFAPASQEKKPCALARNRYIATFFTVFAALLLAFKDSWKAIWPIFGTANQLLAALALLAIVMWLKARAIKTKPFAIPMLVMFAITLSALVILIRENFSRENFALALVAVSLLVLSIVLIFEAVRKRKRYQSQAVD